MQVLAPVKANPPEGGESFVRTRATTTCQANGNDTISERTGFKE